MSLLTGSPNCVKYTLLAFNLVFLITGIILIEVGVGVASVFDNYEVFLVSRFFSIPNFLIVIGCYICITFFIGCWAALKEQYCLILIFSVLLGLIFILELEAGISGYELRNDAADLINGTLQTSIKEYGKSGHGDTTAMWDYVQREFSCCGIAHYKDWASVTNTELPISCCSIPNGRVGQFQCTPNPEDKYRYAAGCLLEFSNFISAQAVNLGAAGVVIAVIQFFGVIFACYIAREVKIRNELHAMNQNLWLHFRERAVAKRQKQQSSCRTLN